MPYIIFKGTEKGNIYKKLIKSDEVISKKCIVSTNNNAWSTNKIIKDWIDTVYCSFFNNIPLENTLLIFDSAPMHTSLEVLKYISNKKLTMCWFQKGLTPILQTLDVSINKPFKEAMKHKYESSIIYYSNKDKIKIKRDVMLKWINERWYGINILKKEMIVKSFLVTGISNKLDGTEDDEFQGFNKIQDIYS